MPTLPAITTVILAGGLGTRIGGAKGLRPLHGRTLIDWVLDTVSRQSAEVLINANGEPDAYMRPGYRVIADQAPDWPGPLAGLQSALMFARHNWVATVPCDTPYLPDDLIARLFEAVSTGAADAAVAVVAGKRQPTIALYHKRVLPSLDAYMDSGGRRVSEWQNTLRLSEVILDNVAAFTNINSLDDLAQAHQVPASARGACAAGLPITGKEK
ncbi:MAG TPA: molybdenum cofactor guanylyltransferase MobA [Gallionella sp.]|nr:molybdenum cofactor guanylyltransferase MobA [Gallionella sp.]